MSMVDERKKQIIWGVLLLIGALGSASLRNNPAFGITPFAVGIIEALIAVCLLCAVRYADWKMALVIAVVTPVYLWAQSFLDGYMVSVRIAANLTLIGCMHLIGTIRLEFIWEMLILALPACAVMVLGGAAALWMVKHESIIRAIIVSWNTELYTCMSIIAAAAAGMWLTEEKVKRKNEQ